MLKSYPIKQLIADLRGLEVDHDPGGWPAVQMKEITALCDAIDTMQKSFTKIFDSVTDMLSQEQIEQIERVHKVDIESLT